MVIFEIVRDILLIIAAIIGSVAALVGLNTWRKQLKGKSEYELAKRILGDVFKLRGAIKSLRSPVILDIEMYSVLKEENKDAILTNDNWNISLVYKIRWDDIREVLNDLYVAEVEAEVHWGDVIPKAIVELHHILIQLRLNLQEYLKYERMKDIPEHLLPLKEKHKIVVCEQGDEQNPDEFTINLQTKIKHIEKLVKVYLK